MRGSKLASLGSPPTSLGPSEFWGPIGLVTCFFLQEGSVPAEQGGRTGCSWPGRTRFSGTSRWLGPLRVWQGLLLILKSTGYFIPSLLSPQLAFSHW